MSVVKPAYGTLVNPALAISANLTAYWALNENTGLVAHDCAGGANDGAFYKTGAESYATWITGTYGPAVLFTTDPHQAIKVPAIAGLVAPLSYMIAFKPTTVLPGTENGYFDCAAASNQVSNMRTRNNNVYYFYAAGLGYPNTTFLAAGTPYVVIGVDDNVDGGTVYINGVKTTGTIGAGVQGAISIGNLIYSTSPADAEIDAIAIWGGRVLSGADAAVLYANPFAPLLYPAPAGPVTAQLNRRRR
jgi:hypothetical protein